MDAIYVAGSMRSGTTWAAQCLTDELGYLCVGESSGVIGDAYRAGVCSCDRPILDCTVWGSVLADQLAEIGRDGLLQRYEHLRRTHRMRRLPWNAARHALGTRAGRDPGEALFGVLLHGAHRASGRPGVVDSSKNVPFLVLLRRVEPSTRVVHLVRDPWSVARSDKASLDRPMSDAFDPPGRTPWSSGVRWTGVNLLVAAYLAITRAPATVVPYESLAADPAGTTRDVCQRLGLVPARLSGGDHHLAVGNPTRRHGSWAPALRPSLTRWERLQVRIATAPARWWLTSQHGVSYGRSQDPQTATPQALP